MNIQLTDDELLELVVPSSQLLVMRESEELRSMLTDVIARARQIPDIYDEDKLDLGMKAPVLLHYFAGGSDWWLTEISLEQRIGFGYVCLNGDWQNSELGIFSLDELGSIAVVNLDLYWTVKPWRRC